MNLRHCALAAFSLLAISQPAPAALVTLTGTNFDVQFEDTQASLGLFGTPSLVSGNILFSANNFFAQSANGQGSVSNGGVLTLYLVPHQNMRVTGLSLFAFGDYRLQGANSYVQVSGTLAADDDNSADPLRSVSRAINVTSPATVAGQIHSPLNNQNTNWQAYSGIYGGSNPWLSTTARVAVTISSTLAAYTDAGDPDPSFAFIQEKLFVQQPAVSLNVSSDPMVVPLPAALPLLLGGGALFGAMMRRRRNKPEN